MYKFFTLLPLFIYCAVYSQNFVPLNSNVQSSLVDLHFIDEDNGFVVGQNGVMLKTSDGGTTWSSLNTGTSNDLTGIHFESNSIGYAVGDNGTIIKTIDGGNNWNSLNIGVSDDLRRIIKNGNDLIVSGRNGMLRKSSDGGSTWSLMNSGSNDILYGAWFTDSNIGFVVGDNGTLLKTTTGGNSWSSVNSGTSTRLFSVYFKDSNNGFIVGGNSVANQGTILKSSDAGVSWSNTNHPNRYFGDVQFLDSNIGFITGGDVTNDTCVILRTNDGGQIWNLVQTNANRQSGICIIGNNIYTCGTNGSILKTNLSVGINDQILSQKINSHPNPSTGIINLELPIELEQDNFFVNVLDVSGKVIASLENTSILDLSSHSKGVYFITLLSNETKYHSKVLLE